MPVKYLPRVILSAVIGTPLWFFILEHIDPVGSPDKPEWVFFGVGAFSAAVGYLVATATERAIVRFFTRWRVQMRFFIIWLVVLAVPISVVHWLCGLAGHWFPRASGVTFWAFAAWWVWVAIKYAIIMFRRYRPPELPDDDVRYKYNKDLHATLR